MRGFLLRLGVGLLTLMIGLGVAAASGVSLMPHLPRPLRLHRHEVPPPRFDLDDAIWRDSDYGCRRFHRKSDAIELRLDVPSVTETPPPPTQAVPRVR